MARKLFPTDITGAVGDIVYQRSRQGTSLRQRVQPLNPQTNRQMGARQLLASLAAGWRGLTAAKRAAWDSFAAGLTGNVSGFNAFVSLNATRANCSLSQYEVPPAKATFGVMDTPTITAQVKAGVLTLVIAGMGNTVDPDGYELWATAPSSQGIARDESGLRLLTYADNAAWEADLDASAHYTERFGVPAVGDGIDLKIVPVKNGQKGVGLQFRPIVVAGT